LFSLQRCGDINVETVLQTDGFEFRYDAPESLGYLVLLWLAED
jgi:hypothetical protein